MIQLFKPMSTTPLSSPSHNEKRTRILEIAKRRMLHYGVAKTTMSEIAEDAQMAVGTIYLYFKNKDEIVLAIAQECSEEQNQVLQTILQNPDLTPSQKLETFFTEKFLRGCEFRTESPHGKELIAYLIQNFPDSVTEWEGRFENAIATILKQGIDQGSFDIPDAAEAAHLLRMATMGFFPPPYLELPKYPEASDLVQLIRWFILNWQVKS
jgi:AcrR family transcriptional regulator